MGGYDGYMDKAVTAAHSGQGVLNGLTFAVKDVFDIKGHVSTAGNPAWQQTHPPAVRHAPVLQMLLDQGAALRGTTITDELMYSLQGENIHYGTPVNPNAPDRIPGGSSSGSASVAAAGLADFAVGTDTGGSVRIPGAYCGLFGFRPTHGAISVEGVIPLARSFDTVGWMARDPRVLLNVGEALLAGSTDQETTDIHRPFHRFMWPEEAWELADPAAAAVLEERAGELLAGEAKHRVYLTSAGNGQPEASLGSWAEGFRQLQGREIWQEHGRWITEAQPSFGPGIGARFAWAKGLDAGEREGYQLQRMAIAARLDALLGGDGLLVIPTAPGEAPPLSQSGEEADRQRAKAMQLTCIAGLGGLPQVTVPLLSPAGYPVGLSFIAGKNKDLRLLHWLLSRLPMLKGGCIQ